MIFIPTSEQQEVIDRCIKWFKDKNKHRQVFEISGPAGSGKTSIIKAIVKQLNLSSREVKFVAYTGKASLVLIADGIPCRTIHSTIYMPEMQPRLDEYGNIIYNDNGKPELEIAFSPKKVSDDVKLIIIDESGMIDSKIAKDILSHNIPIIALGDTNQLDPIEGDRFFLRYPDAKLTRIMRQSNTSSIPIFADKIFDYYTRNLFDLSKYRGDNITLLDKEELDIKILKNYDVLICKSNKMRSYMNSIIREQVYGITKTGLDIGDKIICRNNKWDTTIVKNDQEIPLFNGMSGTVEDIIKEECTKNKFSIDFKPDILDSVYNNISVDRLYLATDCTKTKFLSKYKTSYNEFQYGYALTCHLAQGSQYKKVAIILGHANRNFNIDDRRWLYTAVTRAIEDVLIIY